MRRFVTNIARVLALYVTTFIVSHSNAEETLPYAAYVNDESAIVRSGPGTGFYATDALDWATKVEVHRHDDSVWAAIRPPSGSFSWIPASGVELTETPDLGVVHTEVQTLIGSRLNDRCDVEYVTLRRGDVIEVLGQAHLDLDGEGVKPCYKILPPAGEFRWIRRSQLVRQPPVKHEPVDDPETDIELIQFETPNKPESALSLAQATDEDSGREDAPLSLIEPPAVPPVNAQGTPHSISPDTPNMTERLEPSVGPVTTRQGRSSTAIAPPAFGLPAKGEIVPPKSALPGVSAPTFPYARPISTVRRGPLGPVGKLRLGQELIELELELTRQITQSPETWSLQELRSRAQAVIDTSDEARHRSIGQRIIAKIAQLDDIKRRHESLLAEKNRMARRAPLANTYAYSAPDRPAAAIESSYDGIGWLMPVVTDHPSIPRYVLTDAEGNIKQFVSPKPGLNLSRFEQKRIAIYGQRGYLPTYDQPHLMAERIITLDKVR